MTDERFMIEELRRFITVANSRHVTRSAEELFLTQSALSQSLDRLEKSLDVVLFRQKGKYLELTPEGKAILPIAEKILHLWQKAKDPSVRRTIKPVYAIGMFDNAASKTAKILQEFIANEDFSIELIIDRSEKLFTLLQLQILDIVCCLYEEKHISASVETIALFQEKLIAVSARKFDKHIPAVPFILYNKGSYTRNQIDAVFIKHGIQPLVFTESTSPMFMKELALSGSGVALLPENIVRQEIKQKLLMEYRLPFSFKRTYALFKNKDSTFPKEHMLIKQLVKELRRSQ